MADGRIERERAHLVSLLAVGLLVMASACEAHGCLSDDGLTRVEEVDGSWRQFGTTKDGKKHGQWLTYYESQLFEIEHWINGKRHGPFRTFYDNGKVLTDGHFVQGNIDGRYRVFYEDGKLAELNWLDQGYKELTWCEWYPNGRVRRIALYQKDKLLREELDPPGTCPVVAGDGKRHFDYHDLDEW